MSKQVRHKTSQHTAVPPAAFRCNTVMNIFDGIPKDILLYMLPFYIGSPLDILSLSQVCHSTTAILEKGEAHKHFFKLLNPLKRLTEVEVSTLSQWMGWKNLALACLQRQCVVCQNITENMLLSAKARKVIRCCGRICRSNLPDYSEFSSHARELPLIHPWFFSKKSTFLVESVEQLQSALNSAEPGDTVEVVRDFEITNANDVALEFSVSIRLKGSAQPGTSATDQSFGVTTVGAHNRQQRLHCIDNACILANAPIILENLDIRSGDSSQVYCGYSVPRDHQWLAGVWCQADTIIKSCTVTGYNGSSVVVHSGKVSIETSTLKYWTGCAAAERSPGELANVSDCLLLGHQNTLNDNVFQLSGWPSQIIPAGWAKLNRVTRSAWCEKAVENADFKLQQLKILSQNPRQRKRPRQPWIA